MPILNVIGLAQKNPKQIKSALKNAAIAISKVYECAPDQVWATWQEITPGFYTEGLNTADSQPKDTHPPIATLTCFEGKPDKVIEALLLATSKALCDSLDLNNNIFITYNEAKSGKVIAGNGIIKKSEK